ncbi:response regulator [Candidatus Solincola tengchongensis]|uniref:response regulator n=1 Tax=Candidatus Solincola tengchongensis TaxID=2900693 RepID=UPI00257DDF59|nr:response regulator [Candidatus Solincola tengchongensis]
MQKKILLADDDPDVVEVVSMLLEDEGYEIVTAKDGAEALEKIKLENPDLIILDLLMPHVDGFAVFDMLRDPRYERWSKIPVVILTSVREEVSNRRYELETGRKMDYAAYLEKPADPDVLLETISRLLSER